MKKIVAVIIISFITSFGFVQAQKDYVSFDYAVSFGTGDLGEFISATSWRGLLFEYRKSMDNHFAIGVDVGWNMFYERKDYATYTTETVSISGVQFRYSYEVPVLFSVDYFFRPDEQFRPFVNLGLGTIYSRRILDMGVYRLTEIAWQFVIKPEIGFLYEFNSNGGIKFAAKYYQGFKSGDLEAQSYISLSLGYVVLF